MVEGKKNLPGEAKAMRLEDGFDILDELVSCLSQSDGWDYTQRHDPLILKAEETLYRRLEQIKAVSGEGCYLGLEDAISVYTGTCNDAAILFGLRMAIKLFYAFGRPMEMSQYILAQDARKKVGVCYGETN